MPQIRFVSSLLLSLLFSITIKRHQYNYLFGIILLCIAYGFIAVCIYFYVFFFNLLVIYFLRNYKHKRHVVLIVSIMSLLLCSYYYKVITCTKSHNICGPIMVLVIKLYYLAKELDCDNAFYTDIFNYVFCIPGVIAGPACSLLDFEKNKAKKINNRMALKKLAESLLYLALHVLITRNTNYNILLDKDLLFPHKIFYLVLIGFGFKCRYYFIWNFTDACYIFNGFQNMTNIKAIESELSSDMKELAQSWNIYTNKWLKESVFDELKNRSVFLAATCTFIVSALWHGPKLGYFFMFLGFLFGTTVIKSNHKIFSSFFSVTTLRILGIVQTNLIVNYLIIPFSLLDTSIVYETWSNLYYFVHFWYVISLIGFLWTKGKSSGEMKKQQMKRQRRKSV
ncbi:hypothetical protein VCUG_00389 [Vavraia culicis subsp. floridensis]|uniref:MBOAT family protein n=1 Tax=Vavraia culicis (isolate floridensis) TaxID=948595 RepID=L2GWU8_VAVCU|nr:uncharacterized protein VCUG_00389 [Vavraia culicis subsp. floridensis]ELA48151.1 hypothetical protein VCUG_00389 [Vavraia culicis subsp. floridensis]